jgi:hypothetical protein
MKLFQRGVAVLAVAAALAVATVATAADLIRFAPKESEVVARLDVPKLVASNQFEALMNSAQGERIKAGMSIVGGLTGMDLQKDLQEIYLFARMNSKSGIIMATGRFDQEKMLTLVRVNQSYEKKTVDGLDIHHWVDDGQKYATFPEAGQLVITDSEPAMEAFLRTRGNPETSFVQTEAGKSIPKDLAEHTLWAVLTRSSDSNNDFGNFARSIELNHMVLTADPEQDQVLCRLTATPLRKELVDDYLKAAEGLLAVARLFQEENLPKQIDINSFKAERAADGNAVVITGPISNKLLYQHLKAKSGW